jgi:hypothetical protein
MFCLLSRPTFQFKCFLYLVIMSTKHMSVDVPSLVGIALYILLLRSFYCTFCFDMVSVYDA